MTISRSGTCLATVTPAETASCGSLAMALRTRLLMSTEARSTSVPTAKVTCRM